MKLYADNDAVIQITWNKLGREIIELNKVIQSKCRLLINLLGVKDILLIHDSE